MCEIFLKTPASKACRCRSTSTSTNKSVDFIIKNKIKFSRGCLSFVPSSNTKEVCPYKGSLSGKLFGLTTSPAPAPVSRYWRLPEVPEMLSLSPLPCAASRGQTGTVCYSEALYSPTILPSAKKRKARCRSLQISEDSRSLQRLFPSRQHFQQSPEKVEREGGKYLQFERKKVILSFVDSENLILSINKK